MVEATLDQLMARRQDLEAQLAQSQARLDELDRVRKIQALKQRQQELKAQKIEALKVRQAELKGQSPPQTTPLQRAEAEIPRTPQDPASATQVPQGAPPTIPTGGTPGQKPEDIKGAASLKAAGSGKPDPFASALAEVGQLPQAGNLTPGAESVARDIPGFAAEVAQNPAVRREVIISGSELAGRVAGGVAGGVAGPAGAAGGAFVGGAGGSAVGSVLADLAEGKAPNFGAASLEAGLSVVPDTLVTGAKAAGKSVKAAAEGRGLVGGALTGLGRTFRVGEKPVKRSINQAVAKNEAAKELRKRATDKLVNFNRQQASDLFDAATATGDKLSVTGFTDPLKRSFDGKEWKKVQGALGRMEPPPGKDGKGFADGVMESLDLIRQGKPNVQHLDIGTLQHVRSQMRKMAEKTSDPAQKDRLLRMKDTVDDYINNGPTVGGTGEGSQLLREARRHNVRAIQNEEFDEFVKQSITPTAKSGKGFDFKLNKLIDALDSPKKGRQARVTKGLKEQGDFDGIRRWASNMADSFEKIEVRGDILTSEQVSEIMADQIQKPAFRAMLNRSARDNNGIIRQEAIISFINASRRGVTSSNENLSQRINQAGQSIQQRIPGVGL